MRLKTRAIICSIWSQKYAFQSYLLGRKAVWDFRTDKPGCLVGQQATRGDKKMLVGQRWALCHVCWPSQHLQPQIPQCRSGKPGFPGLSLRLLPWITKIQCFWGRGESLDQLNDSVFGVTSAMLMLLTLGDERVCPSMEISRGEVLSIENWSFFSVFWCTPAMPKNGSPVKPVAATFFPSVIHHNLSTFLFFFLPFKKTKKEQVSKGLFRLIFSRLLIIDS